MGNFDLKLNLHEIWEREQGELRETQVHVGLHHVGFIMFCMFLLMFLAMQMPLHFGPSELLSVEMDVYRSSRQNWKKIRLVLEKHMKASLRPSTEEQFLQDIFQSPTQ